MKSKKQAKKSKSSRTNRPQFLPISEEMRHWSTLLETEIKSWPDVSAKSMFGLLSFYRAGTIFAALPCSRGFNSSSGFILKFNPMPPPLLKRAQADPRLDTSTRIPGTGWFSFGLNSDADLRDAIFWLNHAYLAASD